MKTYIEKLINNNETRWSGTKKPVKTLNSQLYASLLNFSSVFLLNYYFRYLQRVKEKLAIFLLAIYLFGATDAYQLLKLPLLVGHYVKHKRESPYMTLGSFFKMHYIDPQPFDNDYKQDMRLPFKTVLNVYSRNLPTVVTVLSKITFGTPVENPGLQPVLNDNISPLLLTYSIFQPPRA